jgi:HlyD family secretion protein
MNKYIRFTALFAAVLSAAFICSCGKNKETEKKVITGLIDAVEIDVASKVPGRISELFIKEGDSVTAGQKLLTIESEEIAAKLEQVNAGLNAAKAKLKMAKNGARIEDKEAAKKQYEAAKEQLDLAKKMYDRMKQLFEKGTIPQAQYDDWLFKYNVAQDQVDIAKTRYDLALKGARLEEIEALDFLVKQTEGLLSEVNSYKKETAQNSPIDGEVSKIILHKGELAATGYPIVTLVDMSDVWAIFTVREDMLKNIKIGTELKAEIPALGKTITLKVFNIAAMGDFATWKATSEKNSFDLKSFEVKARPIEKVEGLRPGMTARYFYE